jgi:membrane protease YdiL (CAAX protease family)
VYVAARSAALGLFAEASERVELVDRLMRGLSWPYGLLLFALVPGVCEELFFRGLVQRGLLRALAPAQAIAATALLFGLFHGDLQQGTFAALLGAWLGWVAWRTDSVWSAAAGHVLANGIGLGLAHAVRGEMSP